MPSAQDSKCWCDHQSDRISASIVNAAMSLTAGGNSQEIPVYSLPDASAVGFVVHPAHARVLCSYAKDAMTYNLQCDPPGITRMCIPGCMTHGAWGGNDEHTPVWKLSKELPHMIDAFTSGFDDDVGKYNEVVLDHNLYASHLPQSLEAIFYEEGNAKAEQRALSMRMSFAKAFPQERRLPCLAFDNDRWDEPFRALVAQ